MSISENIKAINNKIDQSRVQYKLDGQTSKISALSSGNISKYKFLTGKGSFARKRLARKAAALKKFEYFPLGKKLKRQTSVAEKEYQKLDNVYNKRKTKKQKSRAKFKPILQELFSFYKYENIKKFAKRYFNSKGNILKRVN